MNLFFQIILGIVILALLLSVIRFFKGPNASDRVVALDTMTITFVSVLVLLGFLYQRYIYIDVSLVYAVLGFIGVLIIARYLEGGI
ncbi:MAG: monovalent cation/H+ antiporter complex subunit F [Bacteroidota bacterium]|nr:monovalent cation/H+ antiporter complex subunit F [Bacteroidota bacterium]